MGVSNGIISAPVSLRDPYTCMGVGKYNGQYDLGHVCSNKHGKTNKWSKFKPIRHHSLQELEDDAFETDNHYGVDVYDIYGMRIDISHNMIGNGWTQQGMVTNIAGDTEGFFYKFSKGMLSEWEYLPPRGGAYNEIYRQTDFIGYNHTSPSPMPVARPGVYQMSEAGAVNIHMDEPGLNAFGVGSLSLQDLRVPSAISTLRPTLGSLYRGILFYTDALTDVFFVTERTPGLGRVALGSNSRIDMTKHAGKWKARTFFCNREVELCDMSHSVTDYFIPSGEAASEVVLYNYGKPYVVEITTAKFIDSNRAQANIVARVTAYAEPLTLTGISIEYYTGVVWTTAKTFPDDSLQGGGDYKNFSYTGNMLGATKARFNVVVNGVSKSVESNIA